MQPQSPRTFLSAFAENIPFLVGVACSVTLMTCVLYEKHFLDDVTVAEMFQNKNFLKNMKKTARFEGLSLAISVLALLSFFKFHELLTLLPFFVLGFFFLAHKLNFYFFDQVKEGEDENEPGSVTVSASASASDTISGNVLNEDARSTSTSNQSEESKCSPDSTVTNKNEKTDRKANTNIRGRLLGLVSKTIKKTSPSCNFRTSFSLLLSCGLFLVFMFLFMKGLLNSAFDPKNFDYLMQLSPQQHNRHRHGRQPNSRQNSQSRPSVPQNAYNDQYNNNIFPRPFI